MQKYIVCASLLVCLLLLTITATAQMSTSYSLQPYLSGLSSPVYFTNAKDGTNRNFVVEQGGIIKVFQPGSTTSSVFLNISSKVSVGGERGLLGLAFHPQFASNSYFFVNYTDTNGNTVIARYEATNNNSIGDPNSELILLTITQPFSNHNGGMIEFGADRNLYIGMGDGGSGNDPQNNAQNINSLLGKMLRITPSLETNPGLPYTNPVDNPYAGATPGADQIYAIGLRNPFRWSFDRGGTRQLWAGDVGQSAREEVDIITNGGNYGWRILEGTICNPGLNGGACTPPSGAVAPIFEYAHTGGRCSITGGYVYRGARATLPNGAYVYGDYCTGEIWMWQNNQQILLLDTTRNISSFGEDEAGEIYVVGIGSGTVERLSRPRRDAVADFDGDGRTDFSVFRPAGGFWFITNSSNDLFRAVQFGQNGDIPTPEDFDGDDITDIAVFRPSIGTWFYIRSTDDTFTGVQFGQNNTDAPVAGDYDGDNKADVAVFRKGASPSSPAFFYILQSSNNLFRAVQFGISGTDRAVVGDYDGDGKTDVAVYRESDGFWYYIQSSNDEFRGVKYGIGNFQDIPVPGDYDGDGVTDQAVYRKANGTWFILGSANNTSQAYQFGLETDVPVPGDYDGDGRTDIAVFRPSTGTWYVLNNTNNSFQAVQFGQTGDLPAPLYDAP